MDIIKKIQFAPKRQRTYTRMFIILIQILKKSANSTSQQFLNLPNASATSREK